MKRILVFAFLTLFTLSACGAPATAQPPAATAASAQPTATKEPAPTAVPSPTVEPSPTAVVNPVPEKVIADVQAFKDKGYIPTTNGKYVKLGDFSNLYSQRDYLTILGAVLVDVDSFVYSGHLKVSTAAPNSSTSACGIFFGYNERGDFYVTLLDKSRIYTAAIDGKKHSYSEMGKTSGTGKVKLDDPFEVDFNVVGHDGHAYVLVNGEFIGEYTIPKDKSIKGGLGYGMISGTNKDYGTKCEASNASVWLVGVTDASLPADTLVFDTVEQSKFLSGTSPRGFQGLAPRQYTEADYTTPGTLNYTMLLTAGAQSFNWGYTWCTKTNAQLKDNLEKIKLKFELDGKEVPISSFAVDTSDTCQWWYVNLRDWPVGEYHFVTTATYTAEINDGYATYPAGDYIIDYVVTVKP